MTPTTLPNADDLAGVMAGSGGAAVVVALVGFVVIAIGLTVLMRYLRGAVRVA